MCFCMYSCICVFPNLFIYRFSTCMMVNMCFLVGIICFTFWVQPFGRPVFLAVPGKADQCSPEILNRSMAHVVCHNSNQKRKWEGVWNRESNRWFREDEAFIHTAVLMQLHNEHTVDLYVCIFAFRNAWNTFRMQELNTLNIPFNLRNPRCFPFTSLTCPQATCLVSCFGGNG